MGLIIPIGLSSDLKGPKIIFLIINFFLESLSNKFFLYETNLPMRDLLISYEGFKAGYISASDVFIQISFLVNELFVRAISSNKFKNLNLLNAFISIEFSKLVFFLLRL